MTLDRCIQMACDEETNAHRQAKTLYKLHVNHPTEVLKIFAGEGLNL